MSEALSRSMGLPSFRGCRNPAHHEKLSLTRGLNVNGRRWHALRLHSSWQMLPLPQAGWLAASLLLLLLLPVPRGAEATDPDLTPEVRELADQVFLLYNGTDSPGNDIENSTQCGLATMDEAVAVCAAYCVSDARCLSFAVDHSNASDLCCHHKRLLAPLPFVGSSLTDLYVLNETANTIHFTAPEGYALVLAVDSPNNDIDQKCGLGSTQAAYSNCTQLCSANPSCVGFVIGVARSAFGCCFTKSKITSRLYPNQVNDLYIKDAYVPPPPFSPPPSPAPSPPSSSSGVGIGVILGIVAAFLVLILGALLLLFFCWRRRGKKEHVPLASLREPSDFEVRLQGQFVQRLSLEALNRTTDNFSPDNKLGAGGYGVVYRGVGEDGQQWAVKRAKRVSDDDLLQFENEVEAISKLNHHNLVRLLGYCNEDREQILVYEFMPNGTLKERLASGSQPLTFRERVTIALGAAEGLRYLHTFVKPAAVHRDVKSENILLDENQQAKVADFGLLKNLPTALEGNATTRVAGTPGYLDPEYFRTFKVTTKSDVYSFGVVLLELVTGCQPIMQDTQRSDDEGDGMISLAVWAIPAIKEGDIDSIADPRLREYPIEAMRMLAELACSCLERAGDARPDMSEVAVRLAEIEKATKDHYAQPPELKRQSFVVRVQREVTSLGFQSLNYTSSHTSSGLVDMSFIDSGR